MFRWHLMLRTAFGSSRQLLKPRRSRTTVRPKVEALEDRTLPSAASANPLAVVTNASPPPVPSFATITSYVELTMNQWMQLLATAQQNIGNAFNALGQEIAQELSAVQQQWDHLLGIDPPPANTAPNTAIPQSSTDSEAGRGNSSGSGSGSGAMTTGQDGGTHPVGTAKPLDGGGSGGGSGGSSFNASVTGQIWLDNNDDGSIDENEMDYSGAQVTLMYQVSSGGGTTWSTLASTTTNGNLEGNNYSIPVMVPPGNSYTCEIVVAIPLNFGDEASGYENDINAQGISQVFTLSAGDEHVVGAALDSMNVNTYTDDPNGVVQQDKVTLRDAINTGNNGPPFPAVTFNGAGNGTISLQGALPAIQKSYTINGPGAGTLTVDGNLNSGTIFTVNAASTISGLTITDGSGTNGGGVLNKGTLKLSQDNIVNNDATNDGGGVYNSLGAILLLNYSNIGGNTAEAMGGGLANLGTVSIGQGLVIQENFAFDGGGGIYNADGTTLLAITGTTQIHDNSLLANSSGGGVDNSGTFVMYGGSVYNNTAKFAGGGLANIGIMTLSGVQVYENQAISSGGGGVYNLTGHLTITRTTSIGYDLGVLPNKAPFGGGLYIDGGSAAVSGSIGGNVATSTVGGGIYVNSGKLTLNGAAINGNKAPIAGGIYINGGTVKITGASIYGNQATFGGAGGIYVAAGSLTMKGNYLLQENKAPNGAGGGIQIAGGTVSLSGGTIQGNTCWACGGGIYNSAGSLTLNPTVHIYDNTAGTQGGGMYLGIGSTTTLVSNIMFNCITKRNLAKNQASGDGVYQQKSGANIANLANWVPGINVDDGEDNGGIPVKGP